VQQQQQQQLQQQLMLQQQQQQQFLQQQQQQQQQQQLLLQQQQARHQSLPTPNGARPAVGQPGPIPMARPASAPAIDVAEQRQLLLVSHATASRSNAAV
jgi:hypothetical protein